MKVWWLIFVLFLVPLHAKKNANHGFRVNYKEKNIVSFSESAIEMVCSLINQKEIEGSETVFCRIFSNDGNQKKLIIKANKPLNNNGSLSVHLQSIDGAVNLSPLKLSRRKQVLTKSIPPNPDFDKLAMKLTASFPSDTQNKKNDFTRLMLIMQDD